jgi:DNA polymerase-3 subunit gamma/tau
MLTREAFNALLKTLEEPPEHVKFIFCTTEATKIPITILSRCQRFDFAGILTRSICQRLAQIVAAEHVEADPEALEVLARRAAGSMRDSQSLLEQLLAFSSGRITVADVHGMLGTAGEERLASLVQHLIERDSAAALTDLDAAMSAGVDAAQLIEQLFGYFRDCMVAAVGCPAEAFLYTSPSGAPQVVEAGKQLGLDTLLAIMQIFDQSLARMRYSTQSRILAELALVRISHLENLDDLSELMAQLRLQPNSVPEPAAPKKKFEPVLEEEPVVEESVLAHSTQKVALTPENAVQIWNGALSQMSGMVVDQARQFDSVAISAPNRLVIRFKPGYAVCKSVCERPETVARFEQALGKVTGSRIHVEFALTAESSVETAAAATPAKVVSPHMRLLEVTQHPFVHRAGELFGAEPTRVDDPQPPE